MRCGAAPASARPPPRSGAASQHDDLAARLGRARARTRGRPGPAPTIATGPASGAPPNASGAAGRTRCPGGARRGLTLHSSVGSNDRQSSLQATHGRTVSGAARRGTCAAGPGRRSGRARGPPCRRRRRAPAPSSRGSRKPCEISSGRCSERRAAAPCPQQRRRLRRHVAHVRAAHADGQVQVVDRGLEQRQQLGDLRDGQPGVVLVADGQPDDRRAPVGSSSRSACRIASTGAARPATSGRAGSCAARGTAPAGSRVRHAARCRRSPPPARGASTRGCASTTAVDLGVVQCPRRGRLARRADGRRRDGRVVALGARASRARGGRVAARGPRRRRRSPRARAVDRARSPGATPRRSSRAGSSTPARRPCRRRSPSRRRRRRRAASTRPRPAAGAPHDVAAAVRRGDDAVGEPHRGRELERVGELRHQPNPKLKSIQVQLKDSSLRADRRLLVPLPDVSSNQDRARASRGHGTARSERRSSPPRPSGSAATGTRTPSGRTSRRTSASGRRRCTTTSSPSSTACS